VVGDGAAVGVALLVVMPGAGEGGVAAAPRPVEDWQAASAVATATLAKANIHLRLLSLNPFILGLLSSVGSTRQRHQRADRGPAPLCARPAAGLPQQALSSAFQPLLGE
jgi:hypothetical protein